MEHLELVWQPESGEPRCCEMFDGVVHSPEWAVVRNPLSHGKELVAAAVDRVMGQLGVFTVLDDLLASADESLGGIAYLRGCSRLFSDALAAAT